MNPFAGIAHMLSQPFMQHAFIAGTSIAVLTGVVGFFVVLRGQVFAGDALSHVAYTGALAALAAGVDLRFGLFTATVAIGLMLGLLGGRGITDDVVIGTTFAWVLGLGVLFLALFTTHRSHGNSAANVTVLFGSVFGISTSAAVTAALVAAGLLLMLLVIGRPLLFASLDPAIAAAHGVPVRVIGPLFLGIVGATAAEASQLVGALLLLGLISAPPAVARRLTDRPWPGVALSAGLSIGCVWLGLALAYAAPTLPPSFTILAVATLLYVATSRAVLGLPARLRSRGVLRAQAEHF
jgi:zinc/manganese transport system permease protein